MKNGTYTYTSSGMGFLLFLTIACIIGAGAGTALGLKLIGMKKESVVEVPVAPKDYVIVCGTSPKMWFKEWKQEFFTTTNKIIVKTNTGETYTVDAACSVITAVDKGI